MWKTVILLMYLTGSTTLATPVVGLKKNMEIMLSDEAPPEPMVEKIMSSEEKSEIAMATLNLPSNATSIRADIVDGFSCKNREYGYYADVENDCQIFHVCMPVVYADGKENTFRWSFICPEETVFSQDSFTCMREEDMSFGCEDSVKFYELNRNFGVIDSSMETHSSSEAEMNHENLIGENAMTESMAEKKLPVKVENENVEKIQKRIDEVKPDPPKSVKIHKKKNNLRKAPVRKVTTSTTVATPIVTQKVVEEEIVVFSSTTQQPIEIDATTTAKLIEKLTTKYQRFTRRPDINKENKKKIEQFQKPEIVTVGPIQETSKKPYKPESITVQKRKRPHVPLNLKNKFNFEAKPHKNSLKTSEIIKISPASQEQKMSPTKFNIKKDKTRPPIPEPILIRVEEQPATNSQQENMPTIKDSEISVPEVPLSDAPAPTQAPAEVLVSETELKKLSEKPDITELPPVVTNDEPNKENVENNLLKNISPSLTVNENSNDDIMFNNPTETSINEPNEITVIKKNTEKAENIPKKTQESATQTEEKNIDKVEAIEESMPPQKEQILEDQNNNKNNGEEEKQEETFLNNNNNAVNEETPIVNNNNQNGIDQQSMIINLISSLVNSENSKVDANVDKFDNSQYVLPKESEQKNDPETKKQETIMEFTTELNAEIKLADDSNNEQQNYDMTTNSVASSIDEQQNDDETKNSEQNLKIMSIDNEGDHPVLDSVDKTPEQYEFETMQKFINQQHDLYNHMTHIPVKLLTDDQIDSINNKGDLSNTDALNVIQRIEQILQDEVKDDNKATNVEADKPTVESNESAVAEQTDNSEEKPKSEEVQQSSEEIKPIYQRLIVPVEANLLKDNEMQVEEIKPIVTNAKDEMKLETELSKPTVETEKVKEPSIELLKVENTVPEKQEKPTLTDSVLVTEPLESQVVKEEILKTEPLNLISSEVKTEEIKQPSETEQKEESTLSKSSEIKIEQIPLEKSVTESKLETETKTETDSKSETETKTETQPEANVELQKVEDSKKSDTSSDDGRTSSRSLKHKTRIIDPRKRRFLFKADA